MALKNIKLGTTTYTGIDTIKLRDADVADTYITYNEEGFPKSVAAGYAVTAADAGKILKDPSNNLYLCKELSSEYDLAKTSSVNKGHDAEYIRGYFPLIYKFNNKIIALNLWTNDSYPSTVGYSYSSDNGSTWSTSVTGISSIDTILNDGYGPLINDTYEVLHGGYSTNNNLYISQDGSAFTSVEITDSYYDGQYMRAQGIVNNKVAISYTGYVQDTQTKVVTYDLVNKTFTSYDLPDRDTSAMTFTRLGVGVANNRFFVIDMINMGYETVIKTWYTTDFTNYQYYTNTASFYSSDPSTASVTSVESSNSTTDAVAIAFFNYETPCAMWLLDMSGGALIKSEDMYYPCKYNGCNKILAPFIGSSYIFYPCLTSQDSLYKYPVVRYCSVSGGYSWNDLVAGYSGTSLYNPSILASNIIKDGDGFAFIQIAPSDISMQASDADATKMSGIFSHQSVVKVKLSE